MPGVALDPAGRLLPAATRDDRRPGPAGRDRRSARAGRTVHEPWLRRQSSLPTGLHKAAVRLLRGPQVDLMIMPPGQAGAYLIHFTGSKEHNVRLRGMARDRGWSLSEKGLPPARRRRRTARPGEAAELRTFATEAEAYGFLGLPFIEPELREDRGRDRGRAGRDAADPHSRKATSAATATATPTGPTACTRSSRWPRRPDGGATRTSSLTDHSMSLAIARGLDLERVAMQRPIVAALNERFAAEERAGDGAARNPAGWLPPAPRLRAGNPSRRHARLSRRAPGPLRPGRRLRPRLAPPDAGPAHGPNPGRDPQPQCRRDRASRRPLHRRPRRPRPRMGRDLPPRPLERARHSK